MKTIISAALAAILLPSAFCVTGFAEESASEDTSIKIVTTIFPEYDWVNTILGDNPANAQVTMLLDSGVDLHSYQPSVDDILEISECDLFVYVGGESDGWVDDALKEATNDQMVVINLLEVLGDQVKEEELVEGMQEHDHDHEDEDHDHEDEDHEDEDHDHEDEDHEDEDHDHEDEDHDEDEAHEDHDDEDHDEDEAHEDEDHDEDGDHDDEDHDHEDHDHGEGLEYDEHVWLSLENAQVLSAAIEKAMEQVDPENAAVYAENLAAFQDQLNKLDEQYEEVVEASEKKTLLFGDRFPFRYLTDDYDLEYYAAFAGCSAETEASFETIIFLAGKVDELGLGTIMTIEGTDHRIAETIRDTTASKDQQILSMDSMQGTTAEDVAEGASYLQIMEKNLEVLKEALK